MQNASLYETLCIMNPIKTNSPGYIAISIICAVIAIAIMIVVSLSQSQTLQKTSAIVLHTQEVVYRIEKTGLLSSTLENCVQSYLQNQNPNTLLSIQNTSNVIKENLLITEQLMASDEEQLNKAKLLELLIQQRLKMYDSILFHHQIKTVNTELFNSSNTYLKKIAGINSQLQRDQNNLLRLQKSENDEAFTFHELLFKASKNKHQWNCIVSNVYCWGFSAIEVEQKAGRLRNIPVIITTPIPLEGYQEILSIENISTYVLTDRIRDELPSSLQRILAGEKLLNSCLNTQAA